MPFNVKGIVGTVRLNGEKYTQLRATDDGNCLFHAVGFLLERLGGRQPPPTDAATLRRLTVDRIEALVSDENTDGGVKSYCRVHVLNAMNQGGAVGVEATGAIERYLASMRQDRTWGDLLCVYALEQIYGVTIAVYHLDHTGAARKANFPSDDQATDLRLVTPYTGQAGVYNHFNPLVKDPTAEELAAGEEAPEEKRERRPWRYWSDEGLHLYQPPVCHSQYQPVLWAPPVSGSRSLPVSNRHEHQIDAVLPPGVLRFKMASPRMAATSRSFHQASLDFSTLHDAIEEPFVLTLARNEENGQVLSYVDADGVDLQLQLEKFESIEKVTLEVYTRAKKEPVIRGTVARDALLKKTKGETGRQELTLPLVEVLASEDLAKLTWSESPYRWVAAANGSPTDQVFAPSQCAWTYVHVPSPWDVNTTEAVQTEQILLLEDDLSTLKTVNAATVNPRREEHDTGVIEHDTVVKAPDGVGDVDEGGRIRHGKISRFLSALRDPENAVYDPNRHNVVWQLEDGSHYIATSWASIVVLMLNDSGVYEAHSILVHGNRPVFVASREDQQKASAVVDERYDLLKTYRDELQAVKFKKATYDDVGFVDRLRNTEIAQSRMTQYEAQVAKAAAAAQAIRNHKATLELFQNARLESALDDQTDLEKRLERVNFLMKAVGDVQEVQARDIRAKVRRVSVHSIEGESDFEGPRHSKKGGWDQYFLEPGVMVQKVITQGISSCAGGVTFSCEKEGLPKVLILWHIDFPPYVPIKALIEQIWPDPRACPDLRTIAYVFPDTAELNKYRKAMLYPAAVRDRCETVYLLRGDHLGMMDFNLGSGSEYFGVDLTTAGRADLVFTHDINKRTEMVAKRITAQGKAEMSVTLSAFDKDVFGGYRYEDKTLTVKKGDRTAMSTYIKKVANKDDEDVKKHKAKRCSICVLTGVGPTLFDALQEAATPVLEAPCLVLGERVEQEFAGAEPEEQEKRRWRPGHLGHPPK